VESGFASLDLPAALREDERKGNVGGWHYEMAGCVPGLKRRPESK
jgi:hypothetical protein